MAKKQHINGRLKAEGQIIILECDGNGRVKVLEKVKGFRQPAFWFVQCKGCAKCKRHLTKRAADGATWESLGAGFVEVEPDHSEGE